MDEYRTRVVVRSADDPHGSVLTAITHMDHLIHEPGCRKAVYAENGVFIGEIVSAGSVWKAVDPEGRTGWVRGWGDYDKAVKATVLMTLGDPTFDPGWWGEAGLPS